MNTSKEKNNITITFRLIDSEMQISKVIVNEVPFLKKYLDDQKSDEIIIINDITKKVFLELIDPVIEKMKIKNYYMNQKEEKEVLEKDYYNPDDHVRSDDDEGE